MLVSWSRLRVWKQMWIVKTQEDVMVFWNNDLWIVLHHKFICLLCVHNFSFFLNIDSPSFLLDVTKSPSSFFLSFSNFLILVDFFNWWTVCQTKVQTINVRWLLFKVIWKKNICSFKSQRGNKGSHFVYYDKEAWPHIISKTWLFSLSRNFNSRKKKLVHVKVYPLFLFFFLFFFFCLNHPFRFLV